jgi:oligogalacturonide lyase
MNPSWSRRAFVCALPGLAAAQQVIPSEQKRYRDPATEFDLTRLTDPRTASAYLPPPPMRVISRRGDALLYASDRSGTLQAYRMDLKSGESRQIGTATSLDPRTLSFLAGDRGICYCDGDALAIATAARSRVVYTADGGWSRERAFAVAEDGQDAFLAEKEGNRRRLRRIAIARGGISTIAEWDGEATLVEPRPRRAGVLYGRSDGLYLVNYDGQQNRKLKTAPGRLLSALWSQDGRSACYICVPDGGTRAYELRECIPDSNEDKLIAPTTQFISFARNADGSVFAGVSGSKAAPYILLLLRIARRELTVAEHRASDPGSVTVQFSPNSQRVYYQTDREGKPAIYVMPLERFVENTEVSNAHRSQSGQEAQAPLRI